MNPRYNIALVPADPKVSALFVNLAQKYFAPFQNGYVLGDNGHGETGLTHVTLCQFRAENDDAAIQAFNAISNKQEIRLTLEHFNVRAGLSPHEGYYWSECVVAKAPPLLARQKACAELLASQQIDVLTQIQTYAPHMTLARTKIKPSAIPTIDERNIDAMQLFRPIVGKSTENGVLLNILSR